MIEHLTNGRPYLLDHTGRPFRTPPDGDARSDPHGIALPQGWTFIARPPGGSHTYWHERWDEAMRHAREDAEAMRRDAYLMAILRERLLAVSSLPWHLEIPDEKDPHQQQVKGGLTRLLKANIKLRRVIPWLSQAVWYGRYGVQLAWKWEEFNDRPAEDAPAAPGKSLPTGPAPTPKQGVRRGLTFSRAWPVNGDKIGHQLDHTPYVLMDSAHTGDLPSAEFASTTVGGRGLLLRGSWRERFIIHRQYIEDADFFAPDQAEAIHGVGVRSYLFWTYWLRMQWLGDITDFFDRVGLGVNIWEYQAGNDKAKQEAKQAALQESNRANILVPVSYEGGKSVGQGFRRVEVPVSGADALVKLVEYTDKILERFMVGQEGSSKGSSSGLGNEASAEFQMDTKRRIVLEDAAFLEATLTGSEEEPGILSIMKKYTYPEADFPVTWKFDVETGQSKDKVQSAKTLVDMGIKIRADDVRQAAGFGKPADGDELVEPPQQGQPGPGGPGAGGPGAEGGAEGGDPLAALLGGGGQEGAADSAQNQPAQGQPAPEGSSEGSSEGSEPQGDFLAGLLDQIQQQPQQHARRYQAQMISTQHAPHRYASALFLLPEGLCQDLAALAARLAGQDLAGKGRETDFHVTVLFGIHDDDAAAVHRAVAGFGPVALRLGKVSVFPPSPGSDGCEVVKIDVESKDLLRLNEAIANSVAHTKTHDYHPHITLGYVAPGKGKRYAGKHPLEGVEVVLDHLTFSTRERDQLDIPLRDEEWVQEGKEQDAGQYARDGTPLQFQWKQGGSAGTSKSGLPLFKWVWTGEGKQRPRVQHTEPGTGRKKKDDPQTAAKKEQDKEQPKPDRAPTKPSAKTTAKKPGADEHAAIGAELQALNTREIGQEEVTAFTGRLMGLSLAQMHTLREQIGLPEKGLKSATKGKLAGKLIEYASAQGKPAGKPTGKPASNAAQKIIERTRVSASQQKPTPAALLAPGEMDDLFARSASASEMGGGPDAGLIDKSTAEKVGELIRQLRGGESVPAEELVSNSSGFGAKISRKNFPDERSFQSVQKIAREALAGISREEARELYERRELMVFQDIAPDGKTEVLHYPPMLEQSNPAMAEFLRTKLGAVRTGEQPEAKPESVSRATHKTADDDEAHTSRRAQAARRLTVLPLPGGSFGLFETPEGQSKRKQIGKYASQEQADEAFRQRVDAVAGPRRRPAGAQTTSTQPAPATSKPAPLPHEEADRQRKSILELTRNSPYNQIGLHELQDKTGLPTPQLHALVNELRHRGLVTLAALEGRHGISPRERETAMHEHGNQLGYLSVCTGKEGEVDALLRRGH